MSLPTIFPPSSLPLFSVSGHAITLGREYAGVARGRGHSRLRPIATGAPRTVTVRWVLTLEQMQDLDQWFEHSLVVGTEHFTAEVANQGPGRKFWEAVWTAPYRAEPQPTPRGVMWTVIGSLMLFGDGQATRPATGAFAAEIEVPLLGSSRLVLPEVALAAEIVVALLVSTALAAEITVPLLPSKIPLAAEITVPLLGSATLSSGGGSGGGLTTGIALALPSSVFDVSGSPALDAGTLTGTFKVQNANTFFAGPASGSAAAPTFRAFGLSDLPSIADFTVLANVSGSSGPPTAATVFAVLDHAFGTTQGSILYRNGSAWVSLGPGTSGNFLKTLGAGANPAWAGVTVALASMPALPAGGVYANTTGGSAVPTAVTLSAALDGIFGSTRASVLVRGSSGWVVQTPTVSGQVLQFNGTDSLWITGPGGSSRLYQQNTTPTTPTPSAGDRWFHTTTLKFYTYLDDGVTSSWVQAL